MVVGVARKTFAGDLQAGGDLLDLEAAVRQREASFAQALRAEKSPAELHRAFDALDSAKGGLPDDTRRRVNDRVSMMLEEASRRR